MSEWKEYRFSDFALVNPQVKLKQGEVYSFVEMKDLSDGQKFCEPSQERVLAGGARFQNNDTLFARITPCLENGKICQVRNLKDEFGFGSTEFHVFRGKENISDSDFIFYLSRTDEVRSFAEMNFDGTSGRQRVPKNCFDNLILKLPALQEQKTIAEVLNSLDDKIDLLHQNNRTLESLAETLFRQWFVETSDESWESFTLGELVKHVKPGTNYQPNRISIGIPFLNVRNLENGFLDYSDISYISKEEYERVHKTWQPEKNDVLISRIGTLGTVAVITEDDLPVAVHYNMINLKAKKTSFEFLYFLLKSNFFQEKYFSFIRQSVQEYVAIEDVESIQLKLPLNQSEFKKQEESFAELFTKIKANRKEIKSIQKTRDTLLPKLMSGEVRIEN